jgi:hypothetical protein
MFSLRDQETALHGITFRTSFLVVLSSIVAIFQAYVSPVNDVLYDN